MSKPGGAVNAGTHVGSGNRAMAAEFNERYTRIHYGATVSWKGRHSPTSEYMPHQGPRECGRRIYGGVRNVPKPHGVI